MFVQETKAEQAALDAAQLLTEFDGKDYLEFDTALTWFRRENPDLPLLTELIREEATVVNAEMKSGQRNDGSTWQRWNVVDFTSAQTVEVLTRIAMYRATLKDENGTPIATGHGSCLRCDSLAYFERAETIAMRRCLINAGYSLEMLRELRLPMKRAAPPAKSPTGPAVPAITEARLVETVAEAKPIKEPTPIKSIPATGPKENTSSPGPSETPRTGPSEAPRTGPREHTAGASLFNAAELLEAVPGDEAEITTPRGLLSKVDARALEQWAGQMSAVYTGNSVHGALDFDGASKAIADEAQFDIWKWIVFLTTVTNSRELNRVLALARPFKIAGKAWSAMGQHTAQSLAARGSVAAAG